MAQVKDRFAPEAVVVQCGADVFMGDPTVFGLAPAHPVARRR